jgi:type II secretory pathway pseudopilin PulG
MNEQKGITLIALVITIIILLILAGISVAMLTGENGILKKAQLAKELTDQKQEEENDILKQYEKLLGVEGNTELPDNTETTGAGTIVKLPNNWLTTIPDEVSTDNGNVVIPSKKIANVYAVSDGAGNTVPVPYGFYYVGGKVESGVVISDEVADKNKFKGQEDVPAGASYNNDGTVNQENSELKGNQFVWIPCEAKDYAKINFGMQNSTGWDTSTNTAELLPIQKYSGFYIGRYEAGTSEVTLSGNVKWENASTGSTINGWGWQNGSFVSSKVTGGKITSKAGEIPYYHADYTTAVEMSRNMISTEYVQSGLVTGTMWDMMMKFMSTSSNYSDLKSSNWGNYNNNTSVTYTAGRGRYLTVNSSNGSTSNAAVSDNSYHYGIRTTASSEGVKRKNLYDVAGNQWEWTQESVYVTNDSNLIYNLRGGGFNNVYADYPVCYRGYRRAANTNTNDGFRPALFIK